MSRSRRKVFRAVREVVGKEICPTARDIGVKHPDVHDQAQQMTVTAHHLRQALVNLLILHTQTPVKCPNCCARLPEHESKCHLGRILAAMS